MYNLHMAGMSNIRNNERKLNNVMKLNAFLNGHVGKELSTNDVSLIMEMVTDIKTKAVTELENKVTKLEKENKAFSTELKEFKDAKADTELKDAFVKAGGNADKFDSFKKVAGEEPDYEELFKEFPSLKAEENGNVENPFTSFNNLGNTNKPESKGDNNLPEGYIDTTIA